MSYEDWLLAIVMLEAVTWVALLVSWLIDRSNLRTCESCLQDWQQSCERQGEQLRELRRERSEWEKRYKAADHAHSVIVLERDHLRRLLAEVASYALSFKALSVELGNSSKKVSELCDPKPIKGLPG